MSSVFVSHSSQDEELAEQAKSWLARLGYASVFLDHDPVSGLVGGEPWEERLYSELNGCRALVALITDNWLRSAWCVAEANHAQALRKPVVPIVCGQIDDQLMRDASPPVLRRVQVIRDWPQEAAYGRVAQALRQAGLDPRRSFILEHGAAPYPGLPAMTAEHAAVFFGRDQEITELLSILDESRAPNRPRLILIQGASGSGKSSLLRAGLLPVLGKNKDRWITTRPFRPLARPLRELRDVLAAEGPAAPERSADAAEWGSWIREACAEKRHKLNHPDATVVLAVDQLEEALVAPGDEGSCFLYGLLDALSNRDYRILVVATLRVDFVPAFEERMASWLAAVASRATTGVGAPVSGVDPEKSIRTRSYGLTTLSPAGLYAIIDGPARVVGFDVEPGLASRLVGEAASADALPLLAFVLGELWSRCRGRPDRTISASEYDQLGGFEHVVGKRAEDVVKQLEVSPEVLETFGSTLTFQMAQLSSDGKLLRRPCSYERIETAVRPLLHEFVEARLVVRKDDDGTVEVAHEALFRRWDYLARLIDAAREDLRTLGRVEAAYADWVLAGKPKDALLPAGRAADNARALLERPEILKGVHPGVEGTAPNSPGAIEDFIRESILEVDRKAANERARRRLVLVGSVGASVVLLIAFLGSVLLLRIARSQELAALALTEKDRDVPAARMHAQDAMDLVATGAARAARIEVENQHRSVRNWIAAAHRGDVLSVSISPDGEWIATGGQDGRVRLRRLSAPENDPIDLGQAAAPVWSVRFGPKGTLASSSSDGWLTLWDIDRQRPSRTVKIDIQRPRALAWSANQDDLALGGRDSRLIVIDPMTGDHRDIDVHLRILDLAFDRRDPNLLWVVGEDSAIALVRVAGGRPTLVSTLRLPVKEGTWVWSIALGGDGPRERVALALSDRTVMTFDAEAVNVDGPRLNRSAVSILSGHSDEVQAVAMNPTSPELASGGRDGTTIVWDLEGNEPRQVERLVGHGDWIWDLAYSRDGRLLASAGNRGVLVIRDVPKIRRSVRAHPEAWVNAIAISPTGALVSGSSSGEVTTWTVGEGWQGTEPETPVEADAKTEVDILAFGPDTSSLLVAAVRERGIFVRSKQGAKWLRLGDQLTRDDTVTGLVFTRTHDAQFLVAGTRGGEVLKWTYRPSPEPSFGPMQRVEKLAGRDARVAACGQDLCVGDGRGHVGTLEQFNAGRETRACNGPISSLTTDTSGSTIAAGCEDGTVLVAPVRAVVSAEDAARLWTRLGGHDGRVYGLAFSREGRYLASAGGDKRVTLWDVENREPLAPALVTHGYEATAVTIDYESGRIISGGADGVMTVTDFPDSLARSGWWEWALRRLVAVTRFAQ